MARTPSNMMPLGDIAPYFTLPCPSTGQEVALNDIRGEQGTLVMFICNHCPYVLHVNEELSRLGKDYAHRGIGIVAINSNDVENYPDDSPEKMVEMARNMDYVFPYLFDETQEIAKAYDAACTPDFFLFDREMKLVYRGQLDPSRPFNELPVNGADLRNALDHLIDGKAIDPDQKPSLGCNIKWKNS
jgi:thiol-disulfide isomerase/thioredoxin